MKIALLVIASEILEGKVQDINTLHLSQFLKSRNFTLQQVLTVPDNKEHILNALKLLNSHDLVVLSGGLGPTPDDLTKSALASFLGTSLERSRDSYEIAQANYQHQGRPLPVDHPYQFIPALSRALFNPEGFAPGLLLKQGQCQYLALPGVPREFHKMLKIHLPALLKETDLLLEDIIIRTKGIGEEKIFGELDPEFWESLSQWGPVASLPHLTGVDLTVRLKAPTARALTNKKTEVLKFIQAHPLKDYIWHIGEESLEELIIERARSLHLRFGFAESCTGGLCSDRITNRNGSSAVFYGSVICYSSDIKINQLGVDPQTIEQFDVVSEPVALQMARGLRSLYPVDIAVSLTGYAGPHNKEQEIPVGTVCLGISSSLGDFTYRYQFGGDRTRLKESFCQVALFQLLDTLEKLALR